MSVSELIFMSKDLEYFKDFLANPESFKSNDFYQKLKEWIEYITEHEDEFNYLEDEEWRELRERIIAAYNVKEELQKEFKKLESALNTALAHHNDRSSIIVYEEWLAFLKKNQAEYNISDEGIISVEEKLNKVITSIINCEIADERLKESKIKEQKSLEKLSNTLFESYERTGKRPIMSALQFKKRNKGN